MFPLLDPTEVEQRLQQLIEKHKPKNISVQEIRRRIFESNDEDTMKEINLFNKWWFQCFRTVNENAFKELLSAFQDAWNSFPHSSLAGKSPQQVMQEEVKKHPTVAKHMREGDMPTVTVGGVTRSWDDHCKMIKEMERLQKPFKSWIEKQALPNYQRFLKTKYKTKKTIEKHYDVADHFFRRVLHVGFLDFEEIRPAFAVWEFPEWWPSHILYSNLTEDQVWSSLCDFFWFAEIVLHRSIPNIWEEAEGEDPLFDDPNMPAPIHTPDVPKTGRNDLCACGSGKKFKKCCGR